MDVEGVVFEVDYPNCNPDKNQFDPSDYATMFGMGLENPEQFIEWLNDDCEKVVLGKSTIYAYSRWRNSEKNSYPTFKEYLDRLKYLKHYIKERKNDDNKAAADAREAETIGRNLFSVHGSL